MRNVYGPKIDPSQYSLPVSLGGTGRMNLSEAADALQLVKNTTKGQPNGPIALGANGQIDAMKMPSLAGTNQVNLQGTFATAVGTTQSWKITDYDSFKTYDLSTSAGSISRLGDTVTFTAPASAQTVNVTIAGRAIQVAVTGSLPSQPSITSPVTGATNVSLSPTLTGSAFAYSGNVDTHASSTWQIATDINFTNIAASTTNDTTNKTSWTANGLSVSTTYYARVSYKGASGVSSAWSSTISFNTTAVPFAAIEEAKLVADTPFTGGQFGTAVALSSDGSRVVASAYNASGSNAYGLMYVFLRTGTTWTLEQKLTAPIQVAGQQLGNVLDITDAGDRIVAGTHNSTANSNNGQVFIFVRNTSTNVWSLEQKIGSSVLNQYTPGISGDGTRLIIGAAANSAGSVANAGQCFIYTRSGSVWTLEATLSASDAAASDSFGVSVSINTDGSRIIAGATGNGTNITGYAYVFVRSGTTWAQEQKLLPPSPSSANGYFGFSVDISSDGSRVVIGANSENPTGGSYNFTGQAFIFSRSGTAWTQEAKLTASDAAANRYFGWSVAINDAGDFALVGSRNSGGTTQAAYVFTRTDTTWTQKNLLKASDDAGAVTYYGASVDVSGTTNRICIGASQATGGSTATAGACYIDR